MERGESEKEENRRKYQDLEGVAFLSSLSHGGAGFDSFHRYPRSPVKTQEVWVYGDGRARDLSCAGGPCVPRPCGWGHGVLCGVL
jgi:hypothetical protein